MSSHLLDPRLAILFLSIGGFTLAGGQPSPIQPGDTWLRSDDPPAYASHALERPFERSGTFIASFSPYAHHTGKGNYNSRPALYALEWETPTRWSIGGASYRNSFSQPCWYAFAGKRFTLKHRSGRFFAKITGGVVYGYKGAHKDAVPINWGGYTPALVPSIGYQYRFINFQFIVFGRAYGAMPLVGCELR